MESDPLWVDDIPPFCPVFIATAMYFKNIAEKADGVTAPEFFN
jgi:hypothetical protein